MITTIPARQREACTAKLRDVSPDQADRFDQLMTEADALACDAWALRAQAWAIYREAVGSVARSAPKGLPRAPRVPTDREAQVLRAVKHLGEHASGSNIARQACFQKVRVFQVVADAVADGLLIRCGNGRTTHYTLTELGAGRLEAE